MSNNTYTEDLADFGARERHMLAEILALPLPENFYDDGVKPAFNRNSGFVFLVNSDYQCAMLNDETGKLELFHSTPYNGDEGFLSDLLAKAPSEYHNEDQEYIRQQAKYEHADLPEAWQTEESEG